MTDITARQVPFGQYEFVTVTFGVADEDVVVPYQNLRVDNKDEVRWIDVAQGGTSSGQPAIVYKVFDGPQKRFGANFIVLRCTQAGYTARLLLFTERT